MTTESARILDDYISGNKEAAAEIFDRYVARLTALVRSRLSPQFNSRLDPEDVVQSAFRSFFRMADQSELALHRSGDLWRLLAAITVHKVLHRVEYEKAQKRDPDREVRGRNALDKLVQIPSDEDAVMLIDELTQFMKGMRAADRVILAARLQGDSVAEIAEQAEVSEAKVRRVLERARARLRETLSTR